MTLIALMLAFVMFIGSGASGFALYKIITAGPPESRSYGIIFIWVPFLALLLSSVLFAIYLEA